MRRKFITALTLIFATVYAVAQQGSASVTSRFEVIDSMEISKVPAGFPVNFCLLTGDQNQYVAYYDEQRRMTVASRPLGSRSWKYVVLPSKIGWDSHNYITMALDGEGHLHLSGNMHVDTLLYYRTERPGDITSLRKYFMTGEQEDRCTYPKFMEDKQGNLVFNYRDGSSGKGVDIYNIYDTETQTWSRLLDKPLLDGEEERNAYSLGPVRGPDGWFHIAWVWRDTPDCATNHHLSYARSRDLVHWESVFGQKAELPIVLNQKYLWVDPIPSGGGIINGCQRFYFDSRNQPIITYHKSDENGDMQIYAARPEAGAWKLHVLTDWEEPVIFGGRGSMGFIGISISGLSEVEPGVLTMTYRHKDYGSGRLFIDEETLQPVSREIEVLDKYPEALQEVRSNFEGMRIQRAEGIGQAKDESVRYILQWETLKRNFDRPRKPPLPEPSTLRLYKLRKTN